MNISPTTIYLINLNVQEDTKLIGLQLQRPITIKQPWHKRNRLRVRVSYYHLKKKTRTKHWDPSEGRKKYMFSLEAIFCEKTKVILFGKIPRRKLFSLGRRRRVKITSGIQLFGGLFHFSTFSLRLLFESGFCWNSKVEPVTFGFSPPHRQLFSSLSVCTSLAMHVFTKSPHKNSLEKIEKLHEKLLICLHERGRCLKYQGAARRAVWSEKVEARCWEAKIAN